jgi:hypothetical protein
MKPNAFTREVVGLREEPLSPTYTDLYFHVAKQAGWAECDEAQRVHARHSWASQRAAQPNLRDVKLAWNSLRESLSPGEGA